MLQKYRAQLDTINWAVLGAFVIVVTYVLFGEDSGMVSKFLGALRVGALIWVPLVFVGALLSLFSEMHSAELRGRIVFTIIKKPALYVLACVLFAALAFFT